jgi:hypothetical protein
MKAELDVFWFFELEELKDALIDTLVNFKTLFNVFDPN